MALDFVKDNANYLTYGNGAFNPFLSGASKIVLSAIIWPDSLSTNDVNDNTILRGMIHGTSTGVSFSIDAFTSGVSDGRVRIAGRSVSTDTQRFHTGPGTVGTGAWKHVGGIMDIGGDLIHTVLEGADEGSSAAAFGNTTYTTGTPTVPDRVGAIDDTPPNTTDQFDGRIAELAVWVLSSVESFTAGEWAALGKFASPLLIKPGNLVFYEPFLNSSRTSPADVIGKLTGTITGSLSYSSHPPVIMPRRRSLISLTTGPQTIPLSFSTDVVKTVRATRSTTFGARSATVVKTARGQRQGSLIRSIPSGTGFKQGVNFRSTSGFVTDGADDYPEVSTTASYPDTTTQGNTVGWQTLAPSGTRNRTTGVDARLAGLHFIQNAIAARTYRMDLPAPGSYRIRLASGDATAAAQSSKIELFDDTVSLGVLVDGTSPVGQFFDAAGTLHTSAANWVANNAMVTHTFSTTTAIFAVGGSSGSEANSVITHLYIESTGGGGPGLVRTAQVQRQGNLIRSTTAVRTVNFATLLVKIVTVSMTVVRSVLVQRATDLSLAVSAVRTVAADVTATLLAFVRTPFTGSAGMITRAKTRWRSRSRIKWKR